MYRYMYRNRNSYSIRYWPRPWATPCYRVLHLKLVQYMTCFDWGVWLYYSDHLIVPVSCFSSVKCTSSSMEEPVRLIQCSIKCHQSNSWCTKVHQNITCTSTQLVYTNWCTRVDRCRPADAPEHTRTSCAPASPAATALLSTSLTLCHPLNRTRPGILASQEVFSPEKRRI